MNGAGDGVFKTYDSQILWIFFQIRYLCISLIWMNIWT